MSRLSAFKILGMSARETFSNLGLNGGVGKMCILMETGHILETVRNKAKVTINHF